MMRRACLSALALVSIAAGTASAGPIEWGYLVTFAPDGEGVLLLGGIATPDGPRDFVSGLEPANLEGSVSNSLQLHIGSLRGASVFVADLLNDGIRARQQFVSDLTITDTASGESGKVTVFGRGAYLGDNQLQDPRVLLELLEQSRSRELTLGGNRYQIEYSIVQNVDDRNSTLVAEVSVAPAAATPEPGTLALAGLGLGAVGLVRRLRQTKGQPLSGIGR